MNIKSAFRVIHLFGYQLMVEFTNGSRRIVNLESYVDSTALMDVKDLDVFKRVSVDLDSGSLSWPNGTLVSPDWTWQIGIEFENAVDSPLRSRTEYSEIALDLDPSYYHPPKQGFLGPDYFGAW